MLLWFPRQITRYAMKKDTVFDKEKLERMIKELPEGYRLQWIDKELYDQCLAGKVVWLVNVYYNRENRNEFGVF